MNEMTVFKNDQFGQIRTVAIDGEPWFVAADVCRALEIKDTWNAVSRLDEDEKGTDSISTPGGAQQMAIVNEPGLYSLVLGSRKPEAKAFKRWVTHEVIPAIRKTGSYAVKLSPAEQLLVQAQMLVDQEKRLSEVEDKVQKLEAKATTSPEGHYTIAGYASLRGFRVDVNVANMLGRRAVMLSREYGYDFSKVRDPRFGQVNLYHEDILKTVFDEAGFRSF